MTLDDIGLLIWLVETFATEHKFEGVDGIAERGMVDRCRDIIDTLAAELPEPMENPPSSDGIPY